MEDVPEPTDPLCAHCHLAIPADAPTFQGPTCPCKLHAACATSMLVQAGRMIYAQPTVACPSCNATWLVYENVSIGWHPSGYETPPPETEGDPLPALLQNAAFKKDLKALRTRIAQWRKATAADKAFQVNALRTWRQQVAPYEATLKAMKKEALKSIATIRRAQGIPKDPRNGTRGAGALSDQVRAQAHAPSQAPAEVF